MQMKEKYPWRTCLMAIWGLSALASPAVSQSDELLTQNWSQSCNTSSNIEAKATAEKNLILEKQSPVCSAAHKPSEICSFSPAEILRVIRDGSRNTETMLSCHHKRHKSPSLERERSYTKAWRVAVSGDESDRWWAAIQGLSDAKPLVPVVLWDTYRAGEVREAGMLQISIEWKMTQSGHTI